MEIQVRHWMERVQKRKQHRIIFLLEYDDTKTNCMQVLVFKTNLTNINRVNEIETYLDVHPHIYRWNVDLEDCDNILRIESRGIAATEIESLILNAGYYCEELQ